MEPPSPVFFLKKSGEAITDLSFWDADISSAFASEVPVSTEHSKHSNPYLIAGYSNGGGIDIWNLVTRRVAKHISSEFGIVSICGTNNCEIISLNREGELKLIDVLEGKLKFCITIENVGFCKASCLLGDDNILVAVTGSQTSSVGVWDLRKEKLEWRLIPGSNLKLGMVMVVNMFTDSSESYYALVSYEDGSVALWSAVNESMMHRVELYKAMPVMCMDFNPVLMVGVAGSASDELIKFRVALKEDGRSEIEIMKSRKMQIEGIADVKIRPDGKIVAAGGWRDGSVRVFTLKSLKVLAVMRYHSGTVQSVSFCQNKNVVNQVLASGSEAHKIAIWKIYNDL